MNQGLKFLAMQAQKNGVAWQDSSKVIVLPFYAFIDQLIVLMRKYINSPQCSSWAEYVAVACTDKQFSNLFGSWLKYNGKSLESKLISTLLASNSTSKLSTFLKLRKLVIKTAGGTDASLDNVLLQHQDIIGILHNAYKSPESRKLITEGIKSLFISYRIQQPKIYSCVFVEYALSLHQVIHAQQTTEATIKNQYHQYGTIPQSILGYSSIISQNPSIAHHNSQGHPMPSNQFNSNLNRHSNSTANKYISNFQSIIHEENGLYRKVKSSQVSLQGFKIIDHKFQDQLLSKEESLSKHQNSQFQGHQQRSRVQNSSFTGHQSRSQEINDRKLKDNDDNFNQQFRNEQQRRKKANYTPNKKNVHNNQINNSGSRKDLNQYRINQPYIREYRSPQSLTYTQKYKSPDISYELTPEPYGAHSKNKAESSKIKQSIHYTEQQNYRPHEQIANSQNKDRQFKLIKVEQDANQSNELSKIQQKEGGYLMWKKLVDERNKSFKQKMLKADYQRLRTLQPSRVTFEEIYKPDEGNQSINIIHDSIVRHSGVGRWEGMQN